MLHTVKSIEDRFEEAAYTLRHVQVDSGPRGYGSSGPRGYGSSWPEVVRSAFTAYGPDAARPMRVVPSAAAISRMEECIDWLRLVDPDDGRIIWLRAEGVRWRPICYRVGLVRQTAWRRWVAGLQTIANRVNAQNNPAPRRR